MTGRESLRRAELSEPFEVVLRRIKFSEFHPHVHIEHKAAPQWRWIATWTRGDQTSEQRAHDELSGLLDLLDEVDWALEDSVPGEARS